MKELNKDSLKQRLILEALAIDSPVGLAMLNDPVYEVPKHIELLNRKLTDVANDKINRLAIFMPPRHGKSELASKYFPAWYLGTHPDDRMILTSYGADFSAGFGQKVRDLIKEYGYLYNIKVDNKSAARDRWDILNHKGGLQTSGVGGQITGKGAEIFIIDDPVKNSEEANSPTYREKAKEWYNSTAFTRLTPSGKMILIQTRWHEDDLGGWLIGNDPESEWEVLSLPAISQEGIPDKLGREPGVALWEELWTIDKLLKVKRQQGEYWFSAMYQQVPQPPEGGLLKRQWLQYYEPSEKKGLLTNSNTYTGWDLAISEKETADYTCSCTIKVSNITGEMFIVDWSRDHLTFPEQVNAVQQMHNKWNTDLIGIETVAYQAALYQVLSQYKLPVKKINQVKDKVTRIQSTFTLFEQGHVMLPIGNVMLPEFEKEYVHFPTGLHDDMLDATEIALNLARGGSNPYTETDNYYDFSRKRMGNSTPRRRHAIL